MHKRKRPAPPVMMIDACPDCAVEVSAPEHVRPGRYLCGPCANARIWAGLGDAVAHALVADRAAATGG